MVNLKPLVDGDILRYEIGFGAETGYAELTGDENAIPPWDYVERMLHMRLDNIKAIIGTNEKPSVYITEGRTFRFDIAKTKPYKGQRVEKKPWHFSNLTAYLTGVLDATVVRDLEADDQMAIDHTASNGTTIICSRDKDLKQVPGWFLSWELGNQPQFGPFRISEMGDIQYDPEKNKLTGTGYAWFVAQVLTGDTADNIPGLAGCGPKKAADILRPEIEGYGAEHPEERLMKAYKEKYGEEAYLEHLTEQAQLCWLVRRFKGDGSPEVWEPGLRG